MKKKLTLEDIASTLLIEHAEALGWEKATQVDVLIERETSRLLISRHNLRCCICGGGSYRWMIKIGEKHICERCASDVCGNFRKYLHYRKQ